MQRFLLKNYCKNLNGSLSTKRSFSTVNLKQQQHETVREPLVIEQEQVKETPSVTVKTTQNTADLVNKIRDHALFKSLQTKAILTGTKLNSFARGPLRSNLLVTFELLKLISAEQRLMPAFSTWPQAKSSYRATFNCFKDAWYNGQVSLKALRGMAGEVTWGQVGRALRVTAEMASFYYIGELLGMLISLPFK